MNKDRSFNIEGQKFNRLKAIKRTKKTAKGSYYWLCICDCGNTTEVPISFITKGIVKSCGCLQREVVGKLGGRNRKPPGEADRNSLYRKYQAKSKQRSLPFSLTVEEFTKLTSSSCYFCGIEPKQISKRAKAVYNGDYVHNGIDRLDNNVGYVFENCVTACKVCNFAKNTLTIDEFNEWLDRIVSFREKS